MVSDIARPLAAPAKKPPAAPAKNKNQPGYG
jgi:hypothetical protein